MAVKIQSREKYWRQLRYERLPMRGFFAWEAETLKKFPMTRSYMRRIISTRQRILLKAIKEDWSPAEYRYAIRSEYEARDWLDGGNRPSVYKMIKEYRKVSIDLGEYTPPLPKKRSPEDWARWKGNVAQQKKRWRATHKEQIARSKSQARQRRREVPSVGHVAYNEKTGRFEVVR